MPVTVIKGTVKYAIKNKLFFLFVGLLIFLLYVFVEICDPTHALGVVIVSMLLIGYGVQIIEDVIKGGTRLPKIIPKKLVIFGFKGSIIQLFYFVIPVILLAAISDFLHFPMFDLEELILNMPETLGLLFHHDLISFLIFMISGLVIFYISIFFKELAMANLAVTKELRSSFDFRKIKQAIDIIGWKTYTIGYSKIIFSIIIITFVTQFLPDDPWGVVLFLIGYFLAFIIEYRGMGNVYRVYVEKKRLIPS